MPNPPLQKLPRKKTGINNVVLTMIGSDLLMISATGFISPIAAVFVTEQINGGTVAIAGLATTVFWLVKSVVQVPVSWYADKHKGEADDFSLMVAGSAIASVIPFLYYLGISEVWQVFAAEAVNGLAYGLMVPTWLGVFTRHIDKSRESTEWTVHSNAIGIGFAAAAAVGGLIAQQFGFRIVFLLVSVFMFIGTVVLLTVKKSLLGKEK